MSNDNSNQQGSSDAASDAGRRRRSERMDPTDKMHQGATPPPPPGAANATAAVDELETAVMLSDDDIDSIEMMEVSGEVEQPTIGGGALDTAAQPSVIVDQQPGTATWDDVSFYYREAVAIAGRQPERTGMMWYDAARTAELAGSPQGTVLEYLHSALKQAPDNPALISLVRREMIRLRQHDQALKLTSKLVQSGGDGTERMGALIEAATLERHVKGNHKGALELMQQALHLQPANVASLMIFAAYQLELGQDEGAADALEQLAEVLDTPLDRSACLHTAATLRELRLNQVDRAEQNYNRALELDPDNLPAWFALSYLHQQAGAWHRLCHDLEQIAALQIGNDLRIGSLLRAGVLHLHRTEDLEAAARIFAQAAEVAPTETAPLSRLAHVYEATGRTDQLIASLRRLLQLTLDPAGQAALLMRIGRLLEFQLGRVNEAVVAYRHALDVRPGHIPALQALGAIFRRHGDYSSLLEILLPETEGTNDPARRAMRCVEVGGILADRLQRPAEATGFYQRALELDPDLRLAAWRLGSLFHQQQRYSELAKLLAWQAEVTTDDRSRYHQLVELARLQAGPLEASLEAIESLKRAWAIGQNRIAAMELLELYNQTGNYSELVELLLWEAKQNRDLAESTWRQIQAAMVLEDYLEEHDRALTIFWQVLEKVPACIGAIRAAGQIYYAHGRWQELIKLHQHELANEPQLAETAEPWCRIGRIYEENLGQHDKAIDVYKKGLELDNSSTVALDALERLIRIEQRFVELVPVLQRYAQRRREPHAAADILCRAAELADTRLADPNRAIQLYEEALQLRPDSAIAIYWLSDLQLRQKLFEPACDTLQRLIDAMGDPGSQFLLLLQQARVKEFHLNEAPDSTPYDMAGHIPTFAPRIRIEQVRSRLAGGDDRQVPPALLAAGTDTADNKLGAALLSECGLRCEWHGDVETQREAAHRALSRNQEELAASWCLQRALRASAEWGTLAALLETEAAKHPDPTIRVSLLSQAAQAHIAAGTPTEAAKLSSKCLSIDKQHLPSIRLLAQLATEWQNYTELASLYDQLAATCVDHDNRLQASLMAADCWSEYVGDPVNALTSLRRVLAEEPTQSDAFARARRLLFTLDDFGQLSQLYTRRIAATEEPDEKAQLLRQHIRLLREQLGDTPNAIAELNSLLELYPEDIEALQSLAELSQTAQRWSDAADALARLAQRTEDVAQRQQAWLSRARIALKRLQKPREALSILRHVLKEDPNNLKAKRLLVEVHVEEGHWEEAQRLLDQVTAEGQPDLQVWAMTQQAEVARVGLRDEKMRERYEREALTLASDHPHLLADLVDHYRQHRRQRLLLEMGQKVVAQTTSANAAARLRLVLARLLLEDFNQPDRAVEYLRDSLSIDPKNVEANLLMGEALEHRGEIEGAVESYRKLLHDDPRCVEAYRGLNRLMGVLGKPALATAAASLLDVLGASTPAEKGQVRTLDQLTVPPGTLQLGGIPLRPLLNQVSQMLEAVIPHLGSVFPLKLNLALEEGAPAAVAANRIARVLGLPETVKVSIEGEVPARAGVGDPIHLQIATRVARQPDSSVFRFWIGRELAGAATAGSLLERLSNRELRALVEALFAARPTDSLVQQLRKHLSRALPRKVRKQLDQQRIDQVDDRIWNRYRAEEQRRSDLIGMLICGNPKVAITELSAAEGLFGDVTQAQRVRELMTFAVSDRYAILHSGIWRVRRQQPS